MLPSCSAVSLACTGVVVKSGPAQVTRASPLSLATETTVEVAVSTALTSAACVDVVPETPDAGEDAPVFVVVVVVEEVVGW